MSRDMLLKILDKVKKLRVAINVLNEKASSESTDIGDLTDLTTTDKTNLVSAINEVDGSADTADGKAENALTYIGTLGSLNTTDKTDLVSAVNEVLGNLSTTSGNATTDTTNVTSGAVKYTKTLKVVTVSVGDLVTALELNGVQTIATGLPNANTNTQIVLYNITKKRPVRCQISTDGELKALYDTMDASDNILGTFTYTSE